MQELPDIPLEDCLVILLRNDLKLRKKSDLQIKAY
jgi:hypothetical protein